MKSASYHHGALHSAMLKAAEAILERDGVTKLTMRGAARLAGVSHAAPAHHFGDITGLLSELAAVGFRRFTVHLAAAAETIGADPKERLIALGKAYVDFASRNPGMFQLMFRNERLDRSRPALQEASAEAFGVLRGSIDAPRTGDVLGEAIGAWALVHGFAMLLINGQLPPQRPADELLDAVLRSRMRP